MINYNYIDNTLMSIAIISLPHFILPGGNVFNTLHGYWKPPACVINWRSTGCCVKYISDELYVKDVQDIRESQLQCFKQYYKDNAL